MPVGRAWLVAIAAGGLGLAACSDPTLSVTVDVPAGYRADIASVSLADYESDSLDCAPIAFGDVPAEQLAGALATQVEAAPGSSAALTGVSRLDRKVLVARGLDQGGAEVVAGCATLGPIDGDTSVTIETEPVAIATIEQGALDKPLDAQTVTVRVTDALGTAIPARAVAWRVFGPQGAPGGVPGDPSCPLAGVDGCTATAPGGNVAVAAAQPAAPGPALTQVRVEWAADQPPLVASFLPPASAAYCLKSVAAAPPACTAYRAAAGNQIACLARRLVGTIEVRHFRWDGAGIAQLATAPAIPDAFWLYTAPGPITDQPVAITTAGDFVDATTGVLIRTADFGGKAPLAAALVPGCGGANPLVVVELKAATAGALADFAVFTTGGAPVSSFLPGSGAGRDLELLGAGCISDVAAPATQYPMVVFSETRTDGSVVTTAWVGCPQPGGCQPVWNAAGSIGFVTRPGGEARVASGQIGISGAVVTEWVIDPSAGPDKQLVSPIMHDAISVPQAIASGDLDGDGAPDRLWLFESINPLRSSSRVQVELAADAAGTPITGVSPELRPGASGVIVTQLDDDPADDLVLYSGEQVSFLLDGTTTIGGTDDPCPRP